MLFDDKKVVLCFNYVARLLNWLLWELILAIYLHFLSFLMIFNIYIDVYTYQCLNVYLLIDIYIPFIH